MPEANREKLLRLLEVTAVFTRTVLELHRERPSAAMLGEVSFVASWPPEPRERFVEGFSEALAEAVRLRDPEPVDAYIRIMSTLDRPTAGSYLLGDQLEDGEGAVLLARHPGLAG